MSLKKIGTMRKIDTHAHILPRNWPDLATKYGDLRFPSISHSVNADGQGQHRIYKDGKFFREIWPNTWDPALRIEEYIKFGVTEQVISTVPVMFCYWAEGGPDSRMRMQRHQININPVPLTPAPPACPPNTWCTQASCAAASWPRPAGPRPALSSPS